MSSTQLMPTALNQATNQDLFIVTDKNWNIMESNAEAELFLSVDPTDLAGKSLLDALKEANPILVDNLRAAEQQTASSKFHYQVTSPSAHWKEVNVYPGENTFTIIMRLLRPENNIGETTPDLRYLTILTEAANEMIMQHDPKIILDNLFTQLTDILQLDVYINYIEENGILRLTNYAGISEKDAIALERLEFGQAVCGFVAQSKTKMTLENVHCSNDPKVHIIKKLGVQSYACYPLVAFNRFIGTLSFGSFKKACFTPDELELMNTICSQAAITIERSLWMERLRMKKLAADRANQAKTAFLSMMSHELRTPLNSIIGFTDLLLADRVDTLSENQLNHMMDVQNAGSHLLWLINEILEYAEASDRKSPITYKLEPVKAETVLESAIESIQQQAAMKKVAISRSLDQKASMPLVSANAEKLKRVLHHLLMNAVQYNRFGGSIQISHVWTEDSLKISIADTGTGISSEDLPFIFNPFYRGEEHSDLTDGTGIGLSLARELMDRMSGHIGVESKHGHGSTFWISLPVAKERVSTSTENAVISGTVLYIEDNKMNISLMKNIIKLLPNVNLEIALTGEDGLILAKKIKPDLILLDIQLPKMNGYEVFTALNSHPVTAYIPVIAVSADAMPQSIQKALSMGLSEYVTKPVNVDVLLESIKKHLKN
ncbi:ATP-binding protein [Fictibacillus iocasae]|uniref:histidine kinase n=1 Tax=Fictibacillus iocasae TaxID=2715437 RepID=A0ABW2NUE0_9BACL